MRCESGLVRSPSVFLRDGSPDGAITNLARSPDGTWSATDSGADIACDDGVTDAVCADTGIADIADLLPFPPPTLFTSSFGGEGPGPVHDTERIRTLAIPDTADPQTFADAIAAALVTSPEDGESATGEVAAGAPAVGTAPSTPVLRRVGGR